jgi:hypothetical protein
MLIGVEIFAFVPYPQPDKKDDAHSQLLKASQSPEWLSRKALDNHSGD